MRLAFEYCGLDRVDIISLPALPHFRQLQLQLHSGKKLTIQFDQGLSFWEAERSQQNYLLRFNFASGQLGEEIMSRIQCKVAAASNESTQIFITVDP